MLEVLISIAIFSIGLLSLLALQLRGMHEMHAAKQTLQKHMQGYTLVEMMISIALSMLIIFGVYEAYTTAAQHYRYTQGQLYVQENVQMATHILQHEISMAGYAGCRTMQAGWFQYSVAKPVLQRYTPTTVSAASKDVAKHILQETEAIQVGHLSADQATLSHAITVKTDHITVTGALAFHTDQQLIIADCQQAQQITVLHDAPHISQQHWLTISPALTHYSAGAQIGSWETVLFYIGDTGRKTVAGDTIPALYVHRETGRDEELVENVHNVLVEYLANEHAVKLHLLFSTSDPVFAVPQSVQFAGKTLHPPDRRFYAAWTMIIPLINRVK